MSDGQEKSDDLIAELAKLMASGGESREAEGKPAPKLVSDPKDTPPPRPVRIPGMDGPPTPPSAAESGARPQPAPSSSSVPSSAAPPTQPSPERPVAGPARPAVRIPGMDQPPPGATRPDTGENARPADTDSDTSGGSEPGAEPQGPPARSAFDFGRAPSPAPVTSEPMTNWRDREIPKPAPRPIGGMNPVDRPASSVAPVTIPGAGSGGPARPQSDLAPEANERQVSHSAVPPVTPPSQDDPQQSEPVVDEPIVPARPQPADDSFDFDFGFGASGGDQTPPPADDEPTPEPVYDDEVDPIAELIAADLDDGDAVAPKREEPAVSTPAAAPVPRPEPQPVRVAAPPPQPVVVPTPTAAAADDEPTFPPTVRPTRAERDPMQEIENLIGEAVRVELEPTDRTASSAERRPAGTAPVVPPLTTGFAPRRAAIKDTDPSVSSAEAAIFAAAAAGGAEIGRNTGGRADASAQPYRRPKARKESKGPRGGRQIVGIAVAGTLLLASGFGLYWVLSMGSGPADTEAPVLTADSTPAKVDPPPEAEPEAANSVVFDELDGVESTGEEQLVSRDDSVDTSVADVAQPVGDSTSADTELANRKVRTVTVRPDGTIVSGDDAMAGSEALPVDRPSVPELPGADVQPSELLASIPGAADTPSSAEDATVQTPADVTAPSTDQAVVVEPTDPSAIDPSVVAPVPMPRPANRSELARSTTASAPAATPTTTTTTTTQPLSIDAPASASGPYVQLSSQRTEGDAQASLRTLQARLGGLLGGSQLQVLQVNLGSKGIWYRVVLPTGSFQQATQACATIKANGSDCVPING